MIFLYYFSEEGKTYGLDIHCMKFKQGVEIKLIFSPNYTTLETDSIISSLLWIISSSLYP